MPDNYIVIACVAPTSARWERCQDAMCARCGAPIVFDPQSVAYVNEKHPGLRVSLCCMGCVGHEMSKLPETDLERAKDLARAVVPDLANLMDDNDDLRAWLRKKAKQ